MRHIIAVVLLLVTIFSTDAELCGQERDLLSGSISKEKLAGILVEKQNFNPLPFPGDIAWQSIKPEYREQLIEQGEQYLGYEWPTLPAIRYMDFDKTGNRSEYESIYFKRRSIVADLVMAEIIENEGRFVEDLINGIWLIMEETSWVIPAHSGGNMLHDINDVYVDLFSAETGALLAWCDYFIGEKLDQYTPLIRERLYFEVDRRILTSMLEHDEFWYMGFTGRIPNNWNPWIVSNWLSALLILEKDQDKRVESVWKSLLILDNFLNPYHADGGCDEGPGYWSRAGASLFDCLQQLYEASGGEIDIYEDPLITGIAQYIYKAHIHDQWYINFSDGSAKLSNQPGSIYRFGKAIDDESMMAFGVFIYNNLSETRKLPSGRVDIGIRILPDLFILKEIENSELKYVPLQSTLMPDLEVAVARESRSEKGFFTAIKGGYNDESHNHNDAGSFIVYYDGLPLFIDAGVGTYTSKTFSHERYSIWTMQSAYHNLPSLNGEMQEYGENYKATNFRFEDKDGIATCTMDLEQAYPAEAFTKSWKRTLTLDRNLQEVSLNDTWEQERQEKRNLWHFLLAHEPKLLENGIIEISNGKTKLFLKYDEHFFPSIEEIKMDDHRLRQSWGESLWRITLTIGLKGLRGSEHFTISKDRRQRIF